MSQGAITSNIDVAQIVLYLFWFFFAGLIYYLRREDKREGYPLESERSDRIRVQGFPSIPEPKVFNLGNGHSYSAPGNTADRRDVQATPSATFLGAPLHPSGDPLRDAVGPAAYAERGNVPDVTADGAPMIVPLRVATAYSVAREDPDPRGMTVIGADRQVAGVVRDLWIDRAEPQIRYLEVDVPGPDVPIRVLVPMPLARIDGRRREVKVVSLLASQFVHVPRTASADTVTRREEDRITAYFAGGQLYAEPSRIGPIL